MGDWKPDARLESVRLTILLTPVQQQLGKLLTGSCENNNVWLRRRWRRGRHQCPRKCGGSAKQYGLVQKWSEFLRNSSIGAHIVFQEITLLRSHRIGSSIPRGGRTAITEQEQHGKEKVNFRCSAVGPKNCEWQITGNSEAEIMPKIEQHGREKHNMKLDDETRRKVQSAMHRKAA